jgi:hypothetical protein
MSEFNLTPGKEDVPISLVLKIFESGRMAIKAQSETVGIDENLLLDSKKLPAESMPVLNEINFQELDMHDKKTLLYALECIDLNTKMLTRFNKEFSNLILSKLKRKSFWNL